MAPPPLGPPSLSPENERPDLESRGSRLRMTKQAYCVEIRRSVQLGTHSARELTRAESLRRSFVLNMAKLGELGASRIFGHGPGVLSVRYCTFRKKRMSRSPEPRCAKTGV